MEPIIVWRLHDGSWRPGPNQTAFKGDQFAALPVDAFNALVKEREDFRDSAFAAFAAASGLDWQNLTDAQLDAMEADGKNHGDKKAMDCVRRLYAKAQDATARAEKAEADLTDARQKVSTLLSALRGEQGIEIDGVVLHPCAERDEARTLLMEVMTIVDWMTNMFSRIDAHFHPKDTHAP